MSVRQTGSSEERLNHTTTKNDALGRNFFQNVTMVKVIMHYDFEDNIVTYSYIIRAAKLPE